MFLEILKQLIIAAVFGAAIGLEREIAKKEAGIKTYSLVSLGAALFVIISQIAFSEISSGFDPSRVLSQIIVGIGFIGAGAIITGNAHVRGITTAAGLWVSAGIGAAVGLKLYHAALAACIVTLFVLIFFMLLERKIFKKENDV